MPWELDSKMQKHRCGPLVSQFQGSPRDDPRSRESLFRRTWGSVIGDVAVQFLNTLLRFPHLLWHFFLGGRKGWPRWRRIGALYRQVGYNTPDILGPVTLQQWLWCWWSHKPGQWRHFFKKTDVNKAITNRAGKPHTPAPSIHHPADIKKSSQ